MGPRPKRVRSLIGFLRFKEIRGVNYSVVLPLNSSGFAIASAFVLRTVLSMCSGGE